MYVLHNFNRFFPETCGGIQIHLAELMPHLAREGIRSGVMAAIAHREAQCYHHGATEVYRYPVFPKLPQEPNHGAYRHGGFHLFEQWLARQRPQVYHQHQWTPQCGLEHLKRARQLGIKTVVTLHLPEAVCLRGTLMLEGQTACDGRILVGRCSRCLDHRAQALPDSLLEGFAIGLDSLVEPLPNIAEVFLDRLYRSRWTRWLRPLVTPRYARQRLASLEQMTAHADQIVVVCDWMHQILLANGIDAERIRVCKYGTRPSAMQAHRAANGPLKIAFLGRWDPLKGIHILVEAIRQIPQEIKLQLWVHGLAQNDSYRQRVLELAQADERIEIADPVPHHQVGQVLAQYDVLAVPSQWLETGPLVVPEAQSVGVPVVGSNLGGIAERVRHGVDGLLVRPDQPSAWAEALTRLATEPAYLEQLRRGITPVKPLTQEAREMAALYRSL